MGVRDLGNIVKRLSPASITPYSSLTHFRGKRLAIDANLLTTKFHFANAGTRFPADLRPGTDTGTGKGTGNDDDGDGQLVTVGHRHARAWFWFLEALHAHDIRPVVVFDGQTRLRAKDRENERRRNARELQRQRAAAEGDRGDRLREIRELWGSVDEADRAAFAEGFRRAVAVAAEHASRGQEVDRGASETVVEPLLDGRADAADSSAPPPPSSTTSATSPAPDPSPIDDTTTSPPLDRLAPALPPSLPDAPPSLDSALTSHVVALARLFTLYQSDAGNPVYSRNQALVTHDEGAFFQAILRGWEPGPAPAPAEGEGEEEEGVAPEGRAGLDGPASAVAARDGVELDEVIERSDQLGTSHAKRSDAVPRSAFDEVRRLVAALGVPFLEPSPQDPHEAEGVCSALYQHGLVDYVVSEDTDVAVYGAPLLRKVTVSPAGTGRAPREPMNVLDPERLRADLGLTREAFVDFALLCGTDFTERIPGVGPVKALALIREHSTIEAVLAASASAPEGDSSGTATSDGKNRLVVPGGDTAAYLQTVRDARAIFLSLPDLPLPSASPPPSLIDGTSPAPASASPRPSTFAGSLAPSPPSPTLPALLRSYGIRHSRFHAPRRHLPLPLPRRRSPGSAETEAGGVAAGARGRALGVGIDEWAAEAGAGDVAAGEAGGGGLDEAVVREVDEALGHEAESDWAPAEEGEELDEEEPPRRGTDPSSSSSSSVSDEFERLYL